MKVFVYTVKCYDAEHADDLYSEWASQDGFIIGSVEGLVVQCVFPTDPMLPYGPFQGGYIMELRAIEVTAPKDGDWRRMVNSISNMSLRKAILGYLNTWYPNMPDKFVVKYLG